jgi:NhaP-type Na+/H+ or K+/H+ antiporter
MVNLAIGLLFLFACLYLRRSLQSAGSNELIAEGLLIIGWVALWRPVEMFLYDWWPLLRQQRRFEAIARMPVETR